MADQLLALTPNNAQRISRVVRAEERREPSRRNKPTDTLRLGDYFEVRITSNATGGGIYKGKSLYAPPTATFNPATTVSVAMMGTEHPTEDWYLMNKQEEGKTTHALTASPVTLKTATAKLIGVHTDGLKIGLIQAIDLEPCP